MCQYNCNLEYMMRPPSESESPLRPVLTMTGVPRILVELEKFLELPAVRDVLGRGRFSRHFLPFSRVRGPEAPS